MNEIWKPILNYEGLYSVSDTGRVQSKARISTGNYHRCVSERKLKLDTDRDGYKRVRLSKNGKKTRYSVHRLVLLTFIGECPAGQETRHLDGNPSNNNLKNLAWGTRADNYNDRKLHGTDSSGKRNGRYKHGKRSKERNKGN